jgi:hypothetical protein
MSPASPDPVPRRRRWIVWVALACVVLAALVAGGLGLVEGVRSRSSASEGMALRDLRTVVVAELRYSQSNAGHYDRLECLAMPTRCVPRYPAGGRAFLDATVFSRAVRGDYRFAFYAGPPPARGSVETQRLSPSSVAAFAYVATPAAAGTRLRSFCSDATGRLCVLRSSEAPELANGVCPLACVDLR